jgi:heterodisulfide reductase subunit C
MVGIGGKARIQGGENALRAVRMNAVRMNDEFSTTGAALCYQCAKCSAGCPAATGMTMLPHRAIHLVSLGQESRVRPENTIWLCAACYTCASRCPNDIDIPGVFDRLRSRWKDPAASCPEREVLEFHKSFLRDLKRRGRVHELRVMGEYNLAVRDPLRNARLALRLLRKGRVRLLPPNKIKGFHRWISSQSSNSRR